MESGTAVGTGRMVVPVDERVGRGIAKEVTQDQDGDKQHSNPQVQRSWGGNRCCMFQKEKAGMARHRVSGGPCGKSRF